MDLRRNPDDIHFQNDVRAFLTNNLPNGLRGRNDGALHSEREQTLAWQRILFERGWGAPHWPKQFGGTGWSPFQRLIFDIECARAGTPWINQQGMSLLGPVVNAFGTSAQRQKFIPPLIAGEMYWAQGFSEPGSGSDLASLSTTARREGVRYIVNGQKIWTSHASWADWIFLLVRTSKEDRKQKGISFLVLPLDSPGVTVRPINCIDGLDHLHEVFFDDVAVPTENLIGTEGDGWNIAKFLLGNERVSGACDLPGVLRDLGRLSDAVAECGRTGDSTLVPRYRDQLAELTISARTLTMALLKAVSSSDSSTSDGWAIGSLLKVRATELHQKIVALMAEILGPEGMLLYPTPFRNLGLLGPDECYRLTRKRVGSELMYRRAMSIHGGTNEIQRDLIARAVIG